MEASGKIWSLVAGLVAVLVFFLAASRILTSPPATVQNENLAASDNQKQGKAVVSKDDLMAKLKDMENQIEKNKSLKKGSTKTSRSADLEQLQKQIDTLSQQVVELTRAFAQAGTNSVQRQDDLQLYLSAVNDPVMRHKYSQFKTDISHKKYELINQTYQQEMVDEKWAVESEDTIKRNFYQNESLIGSDLVSVDCRASMCRLSVSMQELDTNTPDGATEQFVRENELLASLSKDMPQATMRSQPDGKGGLKYEIILFREGYKPPDLQNPLAGKSMSEKIDYIERF